MPLQQSRYGQGRLPPSEPTEKDFHDVCALSLRSACQASWEACWVLCFCCTLPRPRSCIWFLTCSESPPCFLLSVRASRRGSTASSRRWGRCPGPRLLASRSCNSGSPSTEASSEEE